MQKEYLIIVCLQFEKKRNKNSMAVMYGSYRHINTYKKFLHLLADLSYSSKIFVKIVTHKKTNFTNVGSSVLS